MKRSPASPSDQAIIVFFSFSFNDCVRFHIGRLIGIRFIDLQKDYSTIVPHCQDPPKASKISSKIAGGIAPRSLAPLRPCVPVRAPRGAASWQGAPGLQIGLGVHISGGTFVQMSVGFIRVSPYWQYVTVTRRTPASRGSFLSIARGFSIKKYRGLICSMRLSVRLTSSIESRALSVFGV